jgi:prepilin-type N-terminal cleavage/methylation domain-containing protein
MKFFKKNNGFTLIEIVVVIGIIALLTVIIYASFNGAKSQSRDQTRITDINSIQLALETYYNQKHSYPATSSLDILVTEKYLPKIPTPPTGGAVTPYNYVPIGDTPNLCISYHLWVRLENSSGNLSSKRGYNSSSVSTTCATAGSYPKVDASADSLIYDVTP